MHAEQHRRSSSGPIIMLAQPSAATNIIYHYLAQHFHIARVIMESPPARTDFLIRRYRRLGLRQVLGQIIFRAMLVPFLALKSRVRIKNIITTSKMIDSELDDALINRVHSANGAETIELIHTLSPQLIVLNGTSILSKQILSQIKCPIINMHAGITPLYRGVHGAYWALAQGQAEHCGVTIHLVDSGIDTGTILAQAIIEPSPCDNFATYPYLQLSRGLPLLVSCIQGILANKIVKFEARTNESKLWSHPTAWQYFANYMRTGVK